MSAPPDMTRVTDAPMEQARELLAAEYEAAGEPSSALAVRESAGKRTAGIYTPALRAIAVALAAQERSPDVPRLEFRPDTDGNFDEIVARFADGMVHVETMSDKFCYVGFNWDDGRYCQWWINSDEKLCYAHEDGTYPPKETAT